MSLKSIFAILLIAIQAINTPAIAENDPKNVNFCKNMARHLPGVSQNLCLQANLVDTGARSVKSVPLDRKSTRLNSSHS